LQHVFVYTAGPAADTLQFITVSASEFMEGFWEA